MILKKRHSASLNKKLRLLPPRFYAVRPGHHLSLWVREPFSCQGPTHVHNCWLKLEREAVVTLRSAEQPKQAVTNYATISRIREVFAPLQCICDANNEFSVTFHNTNFKLGFRHDDSETSLVLIVTFSNF